MHEHEISLADGRVLHAYDTGGDRELAVVWHHGTPNIGAPPAPLFPVSEELGIRWVSFDRPGYGASSPRPDRDVASVAGDVEALADAVGLDRFAVMGHSGGGPHALACAALLPERVSAVVSVASPAPYGVEGLDWFAGMADSGVAAFRAALGGRGAKERHEAEHGDAYDPEFIDADEAALDGEWSWLLDVMRPAAAQGPAAAIDDDLAFAAPWGFEPARIDVPALFLHGGLDRLVPPAHSEWLADRVPCSRLRLAPSDGHVSVLRHAADALRWLRDRT